jgi:hypothetical protein
MPVSNNTRLRFVAGLSIVCVLYTVYNVYMVDPHFFLVTSRNTRHIIRFGTVLIAYGAGLLAYSPAGQRGWMLPLWHFFYGSMLLLLILLGVYDSWSSGLSQQVRDMIIALHEFLISPLPFVVLGLIARLVRER